MADYDMGTAKGKLVVDSSGVDKGVDSAGRSIDSIDGKSRNAAGGLRVLELGLLAVGAAGVAAFGFAIKKAADFEESMSGIKAVSGATETQMESLRKKALKLGADTVFSAGEASGAMEELAKSGLSVEDILNGAADATVNLAAAGEIGLPEAATIAANAMNQFGLSAEQLPHVADLIAGAANASSIDVADFGLSLQQAGAVANLTGLSFDDAALAITAMGNAGIKGSDAGTSLKTFLSNLQPVTEKQIDLFDKLGLTIDANATSMNTTGNAFFDAQGKVKPMREIADQLSTALLGMSDQQKSATLEMLFGSDAIRAAAIIAEEGSAGFDTLAGSMGEVTAADVAATRLDNFNGSLEQLKGSLETAAIQVGTMFLPALRDIVDQGTEWVNKFSEMDEKTQEFIVMAGAGITAAAGLAGGLGLFAHAAAPVASGIGGMVSGIGGLAGSIIGALGPWGLLIVAVAAIIGALVAAYFKFDAVRDIVDTVGRAIRDFAMGVWEWFNKNVIPALKAFADFFMKTIVPAVAGFVDVTIDLVQGLVSWFTDVFVPALVGVWQPIQDAIMAFWGWFDANVISTATAFIELLIAVFDRLVQFVRTFIIPQLEFLWALLSPIISAVLDVIIKTFQVAFDIIKGVVGFFIDFVQKAWALFGDNIWNAIKLVFDNIKLIIETVLGIVRGIIQFITGLITGDWDKAWEGIKTIAETIWNAIKGVISGFMDAIKLVIETAIDLIKLVLSTTWDAIKLAASTAWDLIKLAITAPIELVAGILQGVWDGITSAASTAWDWIKSIASLVWEGIKNAVIVPIDALKALLQGVWDTLKSAAGTAWDAIKSAIKAPIDAIVGFVQMIIDKAQSAIDWLGKVKDKAVGWLPGVGNEEGDTPFVPFIARGAIVTRKTLAWIGEAGPEAVIPLDNPSRAAWLLQTSGLAAMFMDNFNTSPPSFAGGSATASAAQMSAMPTSYEGVHIESANFYDAVDVDTLMAQADFAVQGVKL